MRKLILTCLFVLLPLIPANAAEMNKPIDISSDELHKMLEDHADFILIDARSEKMFQEGHIAGAINIPADKVNSESLTKVAENVDKKLVFYCADINCTASRIGAAKAVGAGYRYVYEFLGGYEKWKERGFDIVEGQKIESKKAKK